MSFVKTLLVLLITLLAFKVTVDLMSELQPETHATTIMGLSGEVENTNETPVSHQFQKTDYGLGYALVGNSQHRAFSNFILNWQQNQQRFCEQIHAWIKRKREQYNFFQDSNTKLQLVLFTQSYSFGTGKPCKLYYVFAMRHIVI